jgi:hypothetical protein
MAVVLEMVRPNCEDPDRRRSRRSTSRACSWLAGRGGCCSRATSRAGSALSWRQACGPGERSSWRATMTSAATRIVSPVHGRCARVRGASAKSLFLYIT